MQRTPLILACLVLSGCAHTAAPGYSVEKQSLEVALVATGDSPHLHVRANYQFRNVGDRALNSLEAILPRAETYGRLNLRVAVNGQVSPPQSAADAGAASIEIPFSPAWAQRQRATLEIEYDLAPAAPGIPAIAVQADSFHLRPGNWYPELRPPGGLLSTGGEPPREFPLSVRAPAGFQVFAAGREEKPRQTGNEIEHRYRVRRDESTLFVAAGNYTETKLHAASGEVMFWSFAPLDPAQTQRAAERLAATRAFFETTFGRPAKKPAPTRIIESRARFAGSESGRPGGLGLAGGGLLNERAFALDVSSDTFLELAEHELAHTWFGNLLVARPEAEAVLEEGLAEYAVTAAAESRGGDAARRRRIALLLRWYDESVKQVGEKNEKPLELLTPASPWRERVFGYHKGGLFFVALEDEFGKDALHRALARMIRALRSGGNMPTPAAAGYNELRAAIEAESSKPAADFFRAWLFHTGIPAEFRTRYAK